MKSQIVNQNVYLLSIIKTLRNIFPIMNNGIQRGARVTGGIFEQQKRETISCIQNILHHPGMGLS